MKTILAFVLMAIVASMAIGTPLALADAKLDSLVNIALQARSQVKLQLDKLPSIPDETRSLYDQGSQQTELLISAAKQGDTAQAKQHFLAAMKTFKQITMALSEQTQPQVTLKATPPPQAAPVPEFDYGNAIKRIEAYTNTLKGLTAKNNLSVDFTRIDSLIQTSKTNLANGDMTALEKTFAELKTAITETQNAIREMTSQRSNDRARSFVNSYITKIDAILAQASELGLSDEDVAKLTKAKEEILSANDPNRIIVIIKQYSINLNVNEIQNAKSRQAQSVATEKAEAEEKKAPETTQEKPAADREEQTKQKEAAKTQTTSAEVTKLEARLAEIQPYVDDHIRPKFEKAESLLLKLKNQETTSNSDYNRTVRMVDLLLDQMEQYVRSTQASENTDQETREQSRNQDSEEKRSLKQNK